MRKPLNVIIVTLSVVCTLKGMSRLSIQRIKAMLLCIVYAMLFVYTVDTKIKARNAFNAIYVNTVDTKHIHTFLPITFFIFNWFSIRKKFWKADTEGFSNIPSLLYILILSIPERISNAFNAIYVNTVDTKHVHTFSAHNFLNIQPTFNPQKVLKRL